jgi:hypothetical protein
MLERKGKLLPVEYRKYSPCVSPGEIVEDDSENESDKYR